MTHGCVSIQRLMEPHPDLDPNSPALLVAVCLGALVTMLALVSNVRRRDPMRLETSLFFGVATVGMRLFVELEPPWLFTVGYMLLATTPFLLLRQVDYFRPVPRAVRVLAGVGLLGTWLIFLMTPPRTTPANLLLGLYLVGYLVLLETYVAQAFVRGAFAIGGVTRRRLAWAAAATFTVAVAGGAEGMRIVLTGMTITPAAWTQFLYMVLTLAWCCYYVAFTPPGWLRSYWQQNELARFSRRSEGQFASERARGTLDALGYAAMQACGGLAATCALWDDVGLRIALRPSPSLPGLVEPTLVIDGVLGRAWREKRPVVGGTLAELGEDEARIASAVGARALLAVPIATAEQAFGLLAVFYRRRPVFLEEDTAVLESFAWQSAIALANARMLENERHMNQSLSEKNAELERKRNQVVAFLTTMSHDLRMPLQNLKLLCEHLLQRAPSDLQASQATIRNILNADMHVLALINESLDLEKIEARAMELQLGTVSVPEIVQISLTIVDEDARRKKIELKRTFEPDIGFLQADAMQVRRVVINLLSNALTHTPEGGWIHVAACRTADEVRVSVRDSGPGISPADRALIFEKYRQGQARKGGTGLGLPISRGLVELHGGKLWVESELDAGSTFIFTLPIRNDRRTGGDAVHQLPTSQIGEGQEVS